MISSLYSILIGIDVLLAIGVVVLVLLQHGKGADAGAAFGSGASSTIFGAQGSTSFLSKLTGIFAALFFINSLGLAYLAAHRPVSDSVVDTMETQQVQQQALDNGVDTSKTEDAMSEGDESLNEGNPASDIPEEAGEIPLEDNPVMNEINQDGDVLPDVPVDDVPDKF